ncbi:MAG: hypothetical protein HYU66_07230 [Armatimonadetes bacterium]|nr:hypothetical protein [Armatimonadota bacterium]
MPPLVAALLTLAAPAPQVLLVAGSADSFTARGLEALHLACRRAGAGELATLSLYDYDLIVWGMDEGRAPLEAQAAALAGWLRHGGVLLAMRSGDADGWLPVAAEHDKAYQLGRLLQPEHPIFTTPHRLSADDLGQVHGGSVYRAFHRLGPGWIPLVGTGAEQPWDKAAAQAGGEHYGLVELPLGKGRIVLCQLIPEYAWFNDAKGDAGCAGARLFENLVRYAVSKAPTLAAGRPPRVVPAGFHGSLEEVLALPHRRQGADLAHGWRFTSEGPWSSRVDRRGVLTLTHADTASRAGGFAQLQGTLPVPPAAGSLVLRWYESDTYCGGREVVLGGPQHGQLALANFKQGLRFARVLVNGESVWEEDVLGRNPQPSARRFHLVDVTSLVRGGRCDVAFRVEDRAGSGAEPFAIDVFFATLELLADFRRVPADAEEAREGGVQRNRLPLRLMSLRHTGAPGRLALAVRVLDEPTGRSALRLVVGGKRVAQWQLTADDQHEHWAVTPPLQLGRGQTIRVEAVPDGEETVAVGELAVIPEKLLATAPPPTVPPKHELVKGARFTVHLAETVGVARQGEIAAQGLPFPRGALKEGAPVRVSDAGGRALPSQVRPIVHWPDGSVRAAVVAFPADVPAGGKADYRVETGPGVAGGRLKLAEEPGLIRIETGAVSATLSTTHGRIVDEVRHGTQVVKPVVEVWDLAVEDEQGRVCRSGGATVTATEIIERGPLRALVVRKGSFADAAGKLLDYRLTVEAASGSPALRVTASLINREDGDVYLRRWSCDLPQAGTETDRVWLSPTESRGAGAGSVLYQHREDTLTWTGADGARDHAPGRAPGWLRLPGVAVGLRWFWQRYPQAIRFSDGAARLDFITPPHDDGDLPTRWRDRLTANTDRYQCGGVGYPRVPGKMGLTCVSLGEALSQELLLAFDGQPASNADAAVFAPLADPLHAVPDAAYAAATRVFGELSPADPRLFPGYEDSTARARDGYLAQRDRRREYGFENFGDQTFEWGYGPSYTYWSNSEYDHHHGFALEYLRSGAPEWWELCEQTARQYRDVVVIHAGRQRGGPHHHNATNLWMPQHDEQCWVADHTLAGADASHSWVEGLLDHWQLTGDTWTGEVVREMADWYHGIVAAEHYGAGGQERGPGWALIAASALYDVLDDKRLLDTGHKIVSWVSEFQDPLRGVISVPISEQPSYEGGTSFMHGIVGRALGRWYDVSGDPAARAAAIGVAEWLTTEPMGEPGTFWYKQSPENSRTHSADDQVVTALSHAYHLSGDAWFGEVAHALVQRAGANVRSMAWYPQALAHIAPLLTPAEVTLARPRAVAAPNQPGRLVVRVRNTSGTAVKVAVAGRAGGGFGVKPAAATEVAAGRSAELALTITTQAGTGEAEVRLEVTLTPRGGPAVRRELSARVKALPRIVRVEAQASAAEVTAPMVLAPEGWLHTPRGPGFVPRPQPEDGRSGGYAGFTLDVPADGEYTVWGEVHWLDEAGNSFSLAVNEGSEVLMGNRGAVGVWTWVAGPRVPLAAGRCKLRLRTREDGARLRRVALTNAPEGVP